MQVLGIALALAALLLTTGAQFSARGAPQATPLTAALALAVFLLQGMGQVCLRWVHYAGVSDQHLSVLAVTASTAGTLGAAAVAIRRFRPGRGDLAMGAGIGVYNLVCLASILTALSHVPGTVFFPIHGCAVVILDNAFAHLYWRELLDRWSLAGAALGACAMLLVL